jgi:hypothetical protein
MLLAFESPLATAPKISPFTPEREKKNENIHKGKILVLCFLYGFTLIYKLFKNSLMVCNAKEKLKKVKTGLS